MESKNNYLRETFSKLLWAIIPILICVAPCLGEDIDGDVPGGFLDVYHTVNLLPGANVNFGVTVYPNGVLNIYAGTVGFLGITLVDPTPQLPGNDPVVTVYGTAFAVDGAALDPLVTQFTPVPPPGGDGTAILTGTYENDDPINLLFFSDIPINLVNIASGNPIGILIDIKPGSDPNPINPESKGLIPVAILTTEDFDAADVDPATVTLAGANIAVHGKAEKLMARLEDVDGDGDLDLLLQVDTQSEGAVWKEGEVILTGKTYQELGAEDIQGSDYIVIVPPKE